MSSWSKLKTIHDSGADPVDFLRRMATVMGDIYVQKCVYNKVQDTTFITQTKLIQVKKKIAI